METEDKNSEMSAAELVHLRKQSKMTQTEMAEELGLSLRGYQKLEAGDSPIKLHYAKAAQFTVIQRIAEGKLSDDAAINDLVMKAWENIELGERAKWGSERGGLLRTVGGLTRSKKE
jgi:transcriptional regulator with XRE-family HTH domain